MNKLISPVPDSQLFVNYLRDQGHNVICITARCESIIDGTRKFLWEQFQITPVFYGFPKKTAMWENGIDIWIDDNEEDCKDAVSLGIETYIIRRSWNENHSIPGVTKFESYRSLRYHFQEKFHGQQECEKREDVRALGSGPVFRSVQAQRATSAMLWGSRPSV
jgi:hypothetical protein